MSPHQAASFVSANLARTLDMEISAAVDGVLGAGNWALTDLVGRLTQVSCEWSPGYATLYLDQTPLLFVGPVTFTHEDMIFRAEQKIGRLWDKGRLH